MSRFNTNTFRSLNESITEVQNPQVALDEALKYTTALESIILSICEELEIDPDDLLEMAFSDPRSASISRGNVKLAQKQEKAGQKPKGFAAKVKAKHEAMKKSKKVYGVSNDASDSDWAHRNFGSDAGKPLRGKKGTAQVRMVRKTQDGWGE